MSKYKRSKNKEIRHKRWVRPHKRNGIKVSGYYRRKQDRNKRRTVRS